MDKLSPRERELAEHLHRGLTRLQVGLAMKVSQNTISNYLKSIYLKLGIRTVSQLVLIVERDKAAAR